MRYRLFNHGPKYEVVSESWTSNPNTALEQISENLNNINIFYIRLFLYGVGIKAQEFTIGHEGAKIVVKDSSNKAYSFAEFKDIIKDSVNKQIETIKALADEDN